MDSDHVDQVVKATRSMPVESGASRSILRDRALWLRAATLATAPLAGRGLTVTIGWRWASSAGLQ